MKKFLIPILLLFFILTGCYRSEITLNVNKNGSGTIEYIFQEPKSDIYPDNDFSDQKFKNEVKKFGDGVEYISSEKISDNKFTGHKVLCSFSSINSIKIEHPMIEGLDNKFITFFLNKKTNKKSNILEIHIPVYPEDKRVPKSDVFTEDEKKSILEKAKESDKEILEDLYISLKIKINGKIIRTNSKHVKNNEISLIKAEFKKILENDEKYNELILEEGNSGRQFDILKSLDGFILEDNPIIFVEFR